MGRFTTRQEQMYNVVLRILYNAQQLLRPRLSFEEYHQAVVAWVEAELVALNLVTLSDIKNQNLWEPAYKRYFMHDIAHHLGLNTHDVGDSYGVMLPNMVLTVEPGRMFVEYNKELEKGRRQVGIRYR